MQKSGISIRDIARICEVSPATVSRVINNNGRFTKETQQRVLRAIEENHYTANALAKSLRVNQSKSIGLLVPDITNEFFASIVYEIENYFFDIGYLTFICNTAGSDSKEQEYLAALAGKMVDGIIFLSGQEDMPNRQQYRNIPMVGIDRRPRIDDQSNLFFVQSDHYLGGFMATEELLRKGCKKILVMMRTKSLSTSLQRIEGYKDALKQYQVPFDSNCVIRLSGSRTNYEEARDVVSYLIKSDMKFDGIFATNDMRAYGALTACQQNGIAVPEDVKIVGFDGIAISRYCYPPITTVYQDYHTIGQRAAEVMYNLIQKNEEQLPSQQTIIVPVALVPGGTT